MRYIELVGPIPPRKQTALNNRIVEVNSKPTIIEKKEYIKRTNTWGLLKKWLSELSYGKCWYCESSSERAAADVDHFRPKAGVTCDRKELANHDGYYWLAYDWSNFRYSCQRCNRSEKDGDSLFGKINEFSLSDENLRNYSPTCANQEISKLLDPCASNDPDLLAHLINGNIHPANDSGEAHERAEYTCRILGLNSYGVPKKKRDAWEPISILIEELGENERVKAILRNKLNSIETEYSSFFKAAISGYRDKDWINELL